ncbi:hypothetical protein ACH4RA_26580 [Streptomyces smyrnaeus]|uniref:hypothetical protein n=1 Tax=Streptomyces TaxID=1883 RepID=UPI000C183EB4|nr:MULTISPECIES: hypothetical protein [unclassified Streptomyces]MBQ0865842.1 hypothetical protein [Streptomyces sp. RK75]MBQ1124407.1 hypothetical protein [Streptomyces sp. B15]MBQ1157319.1 hypothetical protein [Streptomyces sp. A73]
MKKLRRALLVVPAAAVLLTAGTATVAAAATGTPSGAPPSGVTCVSTSGAKACFAAYGDRVWVKDTAANGQSVAGTIKSTLPERWGRECFNSRGKAGGWVMCDFDVPEYQDGRLWAVNNPFIGSQSYTKIYTSGII